MGPPTNRHEGRRLHGSQDRCRRARRKPHQHNRPDQLDQVPVDGARRPPPAALPAVGPSPEGLLTHEPLCHSSSDDQPGEGGEHGRQRGVSHGPAQASTQLSSKETPVSPLELRDSPWTRNTSPTVFLRPAPINRPMAFSRSLLPSPLHRDGQGHVGRPVRRCAVADPHVELVGDGGRPCGGRLRLHGPRPGGPGPHRPSSPLRTARSPFRPRRTGASVARGRSSARKIRHGHGGTEVSTGPTSVSTVMPRVPGGSLRRSSRPGCARHGRGDR